MLNYDDLDRFVSRIGLLRLDLEDAGLMRYDDLDVLYNALNDAEDALRDIFDAQARGGSAAPRH
jgi:hypothetical protein